ncbi:MAG: 16S rRNA (guanine(966)-N(2))-methyltransferase RsmD [Myxococcales bacterium]|nr:16S rRNA (guanine(966)-N(2))-methyltransferase RsmD [Myxococcales bacterium]
MPRIIAGSARGRRLQVPSGRTVRPTADRAREALFNVLAHRFDDPCPGAAALDLFAGAGTLGLEALSRGAARCTLVEADPQVARILRKNAAPFGEAAQVVVSRVERFLAGPATPHSLVLLDPPYDLGAVEPTLTALVAGGWLAGGALVCVEHRAGDRVQPPAGLIPAFAREHGAAGLAVLHFA